MKTEQQVSEQVKAWAVDRAIASYAKPEDVLTTAQAFIDFTVAEGQEAQECRSWAIDRAMGAIQTARGKEIHTPVDPKDIIRLADAWSDYVYVPEAHVSLDEAEAA